VGALQKTVNCHKISATGQLKHMLIDRWAQLNPAIDQLPKRLMTVIKAKGARVEFHANDHCYFTV